MNKDCVSLEVAKKLQKAGYGSKCKWFWDTSSTGGDYYLSDSQIILAYFRKMYPAPTATQLAEELPDEICNGGAGDLQILKMPTLKGLEDRQWLVRYWNEEQETGQYAQLAKTFPDALGLMMVYLLENSLVANKEGK